MKRWVARAARAVGVALLLAGVGHAEAETVGSMKEVIRTVYGTPPQEPQSAARIGDAVLHDEAFETWKESHAVMEFIDGSHLALGANSKLVIDDFVFDPAQVKGNALINLSVGTLRFVTGQMPHGGVVIKTPTATLTLRGTDVTVRVHPDGTTDTTVQSGRVEAHNDINGDTSDLGPGDGATVGESGNQPFSDEAGGNIPGGNDGGGSHVERRRSGEQARQSLSIDAPAAGPSDDGNDDNCGGVCN